MYEDDKEKTNILSEEERRSFSGVTIDEDGRVYDEMEEEHEENPFGRFQSESGFENIKGFHILGTKAKWALLFVLAVIVLLLLSFLFIVGKYLLYAIVIFFLLRWVLKKLT